MKLEREWGNSAISVQETLFHNANGYLGIRNAPEEGGGPGSIRGAYINAFYEHTDIAYGEKLYGFPETKQTIVNLQDAQTVRLQAGGKPYSMFSPDTAERKQTLDTETGVTERSSLWHTGSGDLRVIFSRLASLEEPHAFVLRCRVISESYTGPLSLSSLLKGEVTNYAAAGDPRVASEALRCLNTRCKGVENGAAFWTSDTLRSGLSVTCRTAHLCRFPGEWWETAEGLEQRFEGELAPGEEILLEKVIVYADSLRCADCEAESRDILNRVLACGTQVLFDRQKAFLLEWSENCCPRLYAPDPMMTCLSFDLYQLLQSTGSDGVGNVAAKGLSGEGYEGHTFWDSEMYVFPFFLWTQPEKARGMLEYRCRMLEKARENARILGISKGALFPWRTVSGTECSGYFPAGSAQYHINGDIAYAFLQYWEVTGDMDFMAESGAAVLMETARCWRELGHLEADGFRIDCVTGPDEYTCLVNNNFYTNAVAQSNLLGAAQVYKALAERGRLEKLVRDTGITPEEIADLERCGRAMYFPKDETLGISAQDDSFLKKKKLDFSVLPKEDFPLLLHYHPLFLYRHQVCKQADTVLAHLLFPETADAETMRRSYEYYLSVTTHDSSLSICIFGAMAARLGLLSEGEAGFRATAELDLLDTHGNTADGLHTASLGGAYLALLKGFVGMYVRGGSLEYSPVLPENWNGYDLPFMFRGQRRMLRVRKGQPAQLV